MLHYSFILRYFCLLFFMCKLHSHWFWCFFRVHLWAANNSLKATRIIVFLNLNEQKSFLKVATWKVERGNLKWKGHYLTTQTSLSGQIDTSFYCISYKISRALVLVCLNIQQMRKWAFIGTKKNCGQKMNWKLTEWKASSSVSIQKDRQRAQITIDSSGMLERMAIAWMIQLTTLSLSSDYQPASINDAEWSQQAMCMMRSGRNRMKSIQRNSNAMVMIFR